MRDYGHRFARWVVALLVILPLGAAAQQSERFGDYEVHYSAMPTGLLNAEVAQEYGIVRSRTRGMVMITILRDGDAVSGSVDIVARDKNDELSEIPAERVRDDGWISYVGTFPIEAGDALTFEIEASPYEGGEAYSIAFRQTFYPGE